MAKTTETVHLAIPVGMTKRIDKIRGDVSRSRFITRLIEKGLKKVEKKDRKKQEEAGEETDV
jgi:metal-responsive CopG/Arc/MetJ family transcriptional regulator